ncbi:hypothetical protein BB559_002743 [Furculomyces boomerangus]|uniref:J domain-containing protein n=2 Tax=Harpellales TaxID=61421 RepID=A0A2T9YSX4_9FUNG|nr:hypothetical protein BB559_002743 [Furculomyces boomerangus]PVZ97352.1 hypothetical protein BB558_006689 [Smittium angustum]PVZ99180.1 hypothetical protein BB558_004810 [Smittium angustum]
MEENFNPYETLEINVTSTNKEISKAYRAKALAYHPDKTTNSNEKEKERMVRKFQLVKLAYDVLLDPEKKASIDMKLKSQVQKKEKEDRMSQQRKQMRTELEMRENMAKSKYGMETTKSRREQEEAKKFRSEMDRLETKRLRKMQQEMQRLRDLEKMQQERKDSYLQQEINVAKELEELNCTIRLRWNENEEEQVLNLLNIKTIDEVAIRNIAVVFGPVDHIVLGSKATKHRNGTKRSALIVFSSIVSAHALMDADIISHPALQIFERAWAHGNAKPIEDIARLKLDRETEYSKSSTQNRNYALSVEEALLNKRLGKKQTVDYDNWMEKPGVANLYSTANPTEMPGSHLSFNDFETVVLSQMKMFGN